MYEDFSKTFGFEEYYPQQGDMENQTVYVVLDNKETMDISQYDTFSKFTLDVQNNNENNANGKIADIEKSGKRYSLVQKNKDGNVDIILMGENNKELLSFRTQEIFDRFYNHNMKKELISVDEATFSKENEHAKLTFVVQNVNIEKLNNPPYYYADLYIFVDIK